MTNSLTKQNIKNLSDQYRCATRRLFCFDYDGTLVDFAPVPSAATPTPELLALMRKLTADPANSVAIISGRDQASLEQFFRDIPVILSAEHGCFLRYPGQTWHSTEDPDKSWMEPVRAAMNAAVAAVPESFIEEKQHSLAWHHRRAALRDVEPAEATLQAAIAGLGVVVLPGSRVLEVRKTATTKAATLQKILAQTPADFVLCVGDDITDEAMFAAAPAHAITIKVRPGETAAQLIVKTPADMLRLLDDLKE